MLFICHKLLNKAFVDNGFNIAKLKKFLDKIKVQLLSPEKKLK